MIPPRAASGATVGAGATPAAAPAAATISPATAAVCVPSANEVASVSLTRSADPDLAVPAVAGFGRDVRIAFAGQRDRLGEAQLDPVRHRWLVQLQHLNRLSRGV